MLILCCIAGIAAAPTVAGVWAVIAACAPGFIAGAICLADCYFLNPCMPDPTAAVDIVAPGVVFSRLEGPCPVIQQL